MSDPTTPAGTPRIDIVVVRHPDYENQVTVYVNGEVAEVNEWSFDPGAGYEYADFCEMRDSDVKAAPDFLKDVIAQTYEDMRGVFERWSTDGRSWPDEENTNPANILTT